LDPPAFLFQQRVEAASCGKENEREIRNTEKIK